MAHVACQELVQGAFGLAGQAESKGQNACAVDSPASVASIIYVFQVACIWGCCEQAPHLTTPNECRGQRVVHVPQCVQKNRQQAPLGTSADSRSPLRGTGASQQGSGSGTHPNRISERSLAAPGALRAGPAGATIVRDVGARRAAALPRRRRSRRHPPLPLACHHRTPPPPPCRATAGSPCSHVRLLLHPHLRGALSRALRTARLGLAAGWCWLFLRAARRWQPAAAPACFASVPGAHARHARCTEHSCTLLPTGPAGAGRPGGLCQQGQHRQPGCAAAGCNGQAGCRLCTPIASAAPAGCC